MTKKFTPFLFLLLCLGLISKAQVNLQNGLIAYYTFDFTLEDNTANNFDLTSGGNPGATIDRFGMPNMAYNLTSGNPDFFNGPYNTAMSPSEITLAAWINVTDPFNDQKIAGKTSVGPGYLMGVDSNKLDVEIWDATNFHMRVKSGNIVANTWTHVAISYKANGYLKIFINGLPIDSLAASSNGVGTNSSNAFTIGGAPWDNYALNYNGKIDDLVLYDRQLSNAEILALNDLTTTGINSKLNNAYMVNIYPNPINTETLNIGFNQVQIETTQVMITDALGKLVCQTQFNNLLNAQVEVGHLANGLYTIQLSNSNGLIKSEKLVINKK
jgi:hypothetical protein